MPWLIDTDIMIDVSRQNPKAANYVDTLDDSSISIISAHELIVGARDKRDVAAIESLLANYPIRDVNKAIGRRAYDLLRMWSRSHGLRTFDSLIAATAIEEGLTLATRNRKHYHMIHGLKLEVPKY